MKCQFEGCQEGHFCYGYHPAEYVTRDMAVDAGDLALKGSLYRPEEYEWGACPCCEGNYPNCENCKKNNEMAADDDLAESELSNDETSDEATMISRPVMRYPGGKYNLAKWVISHFPAHETYVELFGGAASVLMRKPRSTGEVYNDLNGDIVNVFRVLRDHKQAAELARLLALTPYANEEYRLAYEPCDDPVERARRMIFRSFAGHGSDSVTRSHAGFRGHRNKESGVTAAQEWSGFPREIAVFTARLQGVCIEQREATKLIPLFDRTDTLFYADPPYLISTRTSASVKYTCEMTDADHEQLSAVLHEARGMVIVSGCPSELYDRLYAGWRCIPHASRAQNSKARTECLWLSPNIHTTFF